MVTHFQPYTQHPKNMEAAVVHTGVKLATNTKDLLQKLSVGAGLEGDGGWQWLSSQGNSSEAVSREQGFRPW